MRRPYSNLAFAIPMFILFFGSLALASIKAPDDLPIGAMIGLILLMLTGLAGWWISRQVFKSL